MFGLFSRGSNNRHNEASRERANNKLYVFRWTVFLYRLRKFSFCFCFCRSFDSQNNNRGGYNVGDDGTMYYYTDSVLPIQWFALNSSWLYKPFNVLLFLKGQINIRVTMLILIALSYCSTHVPIIFVMENRRCLLNKCNSNPHEQVLISI